MLSTHALSFTYRGGAAMRFADVNLPQGGLLLLQGASGSGKSTLLALCCGLLQAESGRIEVAGQELSQLAGAARDAWRGRTVGFLPQRLHLSESLTVRGNLGLAFFAAGLREEPEKIEAALAALGVAQVLQRRPSELSGGQAQRVALARAVLLSPPIILADEPTASLDDEAAQQAIELLLAAARRCGASLVVATHDARVKEALAQTRAPMHTLKLEKPRKIGL
jgi:putative ABC transport system ATP-binding protein